MSGVYIKGIEIPSDKPFALLLCTDGSVGAFDVLAGELHARSNEVYEYRAIPVPDHGRLIDADALYRRIKTECNPYGKPTIGYDEGNKVMHVIIGTPTIIPADKET